MLIGENARAGGGVVLSDDSCVVTIGFYTAHLTVYQPQTSGNKEFCREYPDTGETIFVLDYLHSSLKEVPVSLRIIRDATGLGRFVKSTDIEKLDDIEKYTVYFQPPVVEPDASFRATHNFESKGDYVGIVTAGHPSKALTYVAVFPFSVGMSRFPYAIVIFLLAILLLAAYLFRMSRIGKDAAGSTA
jgi:hypothetical protein